MAKSARFRKLETRLQAIGANLLPATNPTGNYTRRQQDEIRGYLLLAHAEIEAYLEDRVVTKVVKAFDEWQVKRSRSNVLTALVSFRDDEISFKSPSIDHTLRLRIEKIKNIFLYWVKMKNHGIREENILKLLLPIGIEIHQIDPTWLTVMDGFGQLRGAVAHSTWATQQPLDPATLVATIAIIMTEMGKLDDKITKLK